MLFRLQPLVRFVSNSMSRTPSVKELESVIRVLNPSSVSLSVHVKPNCKKTGIEWEEEQLQIRLSSPPTENKANKEVCEVVSDIADIPKSQVGEGVLFPFRSPLFGEGNLGTRN